MRKRLHIKETRDLIILINGRYGNKESLKFLDFIIWFTCTFGKLWKILLENGENAENFASVSLNI